MKRALEVLNELKQKQIIKDYAIGGAIAALKWVEPFFTQDLDVFVILEENTSIKGIIDLSPIYEYLKKKGYIWEKHWVVIEGVPVDIFPADEFEKKAIEEALEAEYDGVKTKIITPEYLIALFLRTNRDKDIRKMQMLLEQTEVNMKKLRKILVQFGLDSKFNDFKRKYYGK
uniref:Nucleotidyltransferase family protein n=1 Tax=candidate division WOR-3 bacterium TaxID=2052148 RepID=A0A7C4TBS4_UNCW3